MGKMGEELKRTYVPFTEWKEKSKQIEYTEKTPLLSPETGNFLQKAGQEEMFLNITEIM